MTRLFSFAAFALGAVVVLWMGGGFIGANPLALVVTALIAAAYTLGFVELVGYQHASRSLATALHNLADAQADLSRWLAEIHPSLRSAVRQRIHGEHLGLPAPVMTPYLVGLLVMLGLLGTFIGMVSTLQGAVTALQGSTELSAIRDGLAAPIQGLGLAFATSVAGITASAMLGLISALSRRERLALSRQLDSEMGGGLKNHSLGQQRRDTYQALQQQSALLPSVVGRLDQLAAQMEQATRDTSQHLLDSQQAFQQSLVSGVDTLLQAVDDHIKSSVTESSRRAAEAVTPVLADFLNKLEGRHADQRQQLNAHFDQQLAGVVGRFTDAAAEVTQGWRDSLSGQRDTNTAVAAALQQSAETLQQRLAEQGQVLLSELRAQGQQWQQQQQDAASSWTLSLQQGSEQLQALGRDHAAKASEQIAQLVSRSDALLAARETAEARWQQQQAEGLAAIEARHGDYLDQWQGQHQAGLQAAVAQFEQLQTQVASQLAALAEALEQPLQRLIATASETPKVAAEVIAKLQSEITSNIARDNALLQEREQLITQLGALSESLTEGSRAQGEAVTTLLQQSATTLDKVADNFADKVDGQSQQLVSVLDQFSASSAELATLGEAFTAAVSRFGEVTEQSAQVQAQLERALESAAQRGDEQMQYYLAQAREIIDHNLLTQQELLGRLGAAGLAGVQA